MKINILMSTYNGEQFLAEQIESIRNQTIQEWRLLIRDDGSSDKTPEIIEEYVAKDSRIHFINAENRENYGVIKNFFTLLKYEKADYYFFSDQDDIWLPDKMAIQLEEAKKYDTDTPLLVYTDLKVVNSHLETMYDSMISYQSNHANTSLLEELTENTVTGGTTLINHALASYWADPSDLLMHDWFLALIAASMGNLVYLDSVTELYRQHEANVLGARTWSKRMKTWLKPQLLLKKYWWLIESSQKQAEKLLELPIDQKERKQVSHFVTILEQPIMTRIAHLKKYGYKKNRAFHTFVFRTLIITKLGYRRK
ncbi:glycosyltransferase family 2 protein [Streptococcus porcinus]|uniref:Glycosyltransferase family 2 protein n=1 Tax=Streptococcus porcinus TaxID=1340 RepID=A0A7V9WQ51_STRPO|nr:glycosyltransferase family 2 protein [Streptococcus porcinus]MBA2795028.1 glycosyltransferase family 2 protein [Streptococcus porcinus]